MTNRREQEMAGKALVYKPNCGVGGQGVSEALSSLISAALCYSAVTHSHFTEEATRPFFLFAAVLSPLCQFSSTPAVKILLSMTGKPANAMLDTLPSSKKPAFYLSLIRLFAPRKFFK